LAGAFGRFDLGKLRSVLLRGGFGQNFNELDVVGLNCFIYEYLEVAEQVSVLVEVLVLVDVEGGVYEFACLFIPNLC
jgi:hypothetical protein